MNDFYITLPSHSSKTEFPDNTANSFKIRLPHPIQLEGGGWKVGLAAVSLPDPCNRLPNVLTNNDTTLFRSQWLATNTHASNDPHNTYSAVFQVRDLLKVSDLDAMDGPTLMNDMTTFFNKKKVEKSLRKGWKLSDADGDRKSVV